MKNEEASQLSKSKSQTIKLETLLLLLIGAMTLIGLALFVIRQSQSEASIEYRRFADIHLLRAELKSEGNSTITGFIEIHESLDGIVNIIGSIKGMGKGATHSIHVLEYSSLPNSTQLLNHLNPSRSNHSCPTISENSMPYHEGDIGNVIANSEGMFNFSLLRHVSIKAFIGRRVVILNTKDNCSPQYWSDKGEEVVSAGVLSVFKISKLLSKKEEIDYSDYLMREVNTASKADFEKKMDLSVRTAADETSTAVSLLQRIEKKAKNNHLK